MWHTQIEEGCLRLFKMPNNNIVQFVLCHLFDIWTTWWLFCQNRTKSLFRMYLVPVAISRTQCGRYLSIHSRYIYIFHWLSTWECFRREDEQIISVLIFSAIISAYVQLFCNSDSIVFFFVYVAHKNLVLMMLGQMLLKSQVSFWRTRIWCQCSVLVRLFNKTKASRKNGTKKSKLNLYV